MKVSLLGTGRIGFPMAQRLLQAGHKVTVYNRTRSKAEPLKDSGARVVTGIDEAVAKAQCVIMMLSDAKAIREVLMVQPPLEFQRCVVIQMGTIYPLESKEFLEYIVQRGGEYFECPVLGSKAEAKEGRLILMVGSTKEQFVQWKDFLKCLGPQPRWVGEVGKAAVLKLAFNQLIASLATAFSISLAAIRRYGIDAETFMTILRESVLYAPMFDKKLPGMLKREFTNPNFSLKLLLKDVDLFLKWGKNQGLPLVHLEGVRMILQRALDAGLADEDYTALYNIVDPVNEKGGPS